jgi:hypothetical protein
MSTLYRPWLAAACLALTVPPPATAQEPPGQQDLIKQLQAKSSLADEERAHVRAWVEQRVQAIAAGPAASAAQAVAELRTNYTGSADFKDTYATSAIELIGAAYKRAERGAAAQLIATLNTLAEASTYKLLTEALGDQRVPVRTAAVIGLRHLRQKLVGRGDDSLSQSIRALREAGKGESSAVALQLIYRALDYTDVGANPADLKADALALLELLEARAAQYAAENVKAEAADTPGLTTAVKLLAQFNEEERGRLAAASARMLHYGVKRYTSELHKIDDKTSSPVQIPLRDRMELFVAAAEALLSKLTPAPDKPDFKTVTKEMQERKREDKPTYMKIAMNAWADVLAQRFQIDVHMEITEESEEGAATTEETEEEPEAPEP